MWVKSEYAGELAVISAWLAALLPWNVTRLSLGPLGTMWYFRYPFFQVQFVNININVGESGTLSQAGIRLASGIWLADPVSAARFYAEGSSANANAAWVVGSAIVAVAFLLSLGMYFREETFMSLPVDVVRVMGGLLLVGSLVLGVSSYLFWTEAAGVPIPVGTGVMFVLSTTLLLVDRREFEGETVPAESDV